MQIAIKISQSYYDQIMSTEDFYLSSLEKAIKNGTPLEEVFKVGLLKDCESCKVSTKEVLEDIKAEIEQHREEEEPHLCDYRYHRNEGLDTALDVIDSYISEKGVSE